MSYVISELNPTKGFHPTSTSTIHLSPPPMVYESCSLHLYYTFPPLVFVDTHELTQRGEYYNFSHWGSRDLEKPVHALPSELSEVLVNIALPSEEEWDIVDGETIRIEVPMHLRYGTPRSTRSKAADEESKREPYEKIQVDWPKAFLLCPATTSLKAKTALPSLPAHVFAALPSGKPRTKILIPIPAHPSHTKTSSTVLLPVGDTSDLAFVEPLTAFTILLCFLWLFKVSWRTARRLNDGSDRGKEE